MKKTILILSALLLIYGCSEDNSSEEEQSNTSSGLISRIENDAAPAWDMGDNFYYQDGKPQFLDIAGCSLLKYYFEYGSNDKISKAYRFQETDFDIDNVDVQEIKANNEPANYIYENGNLDRIEDGTFGTDFFLYFPDGKLKEYEIPGDYKYIFEYSDNLLSKITFLDIIGGGDISEFTFEFDDKKNPIFDTYSQFGLFDVEICRELESVMMFRRLPIFENNITRIYRDGELALSATYQYLDNNYPERVIVTEVNGDQNSEFITYQ